MTTSPRRHSAAGSPASGASSVSGVSLASGASPASGATPATQTRYTRVPPPGAITTTVTGAPASSATWWPLAGSPSASAGPMRTVAPGWAAAARTVACATPSAARPAYSARSGENVPKSTPSIASEARPTAGPAAAISDPSAPRTCNGVPAGRPPANSSRKGWFPNSGPPMR